ncbi:MAG TPA: nucleoside deaminase [Planctomycetota bacterium]|jgi:tRNA(adenine34) deaminase|nr:MAG: tRNA-specific adenosine deaminase [Planctomycetes bacterium ADurb.Bin069]HNU25537.1 nucleoside deaminase [Planctomycetota bacterium]HQJ54300.1 nucleoside deaminase [Planctomycetota bacterium]
MADAGDRRFMERALIEARAALAHGDVPIGAVAVDRATGQIVGRGHNQRELLQDPTAHAEMLALTAAAAHFRSWRLVNVDLFVTLEPCPMCAGACVLARIPRLVYAAVDPKAGAHASVMRLFETPGLNHRVAVEAGLLAEQSAELLREFFEALRAAKSGGEGREPLLGA